ncbi:MAG: DUF2804 domain-containing protein [Lachnospiraceae bacterium]|nr:DUF2804 domain-containing protein [Lachnospiraceae bacterium]
MRNHEVTTKQRLLDENGQIAEPGWSRQLLQEYRREDIKAPRSRIKEWDYYLVTAKDFGIAMTISDLGYIGMQSATFFHFAQKWEHTEMLLNPMPMGSMNLPSHSGAGVTEYKDDRLHSKVVVENNTRHLTCDFKHFHGDKDLKMDILLTQPEMDTMVIATPWDKPHRFYYNQKINCLPASGWVEYGGERYEFHPETDFATMDWGRGVWTYDNTWIWGTGNGLIEGKPFGFNIGYGFANTSAASENLLIYDGVGHKLDDITCHFDTSDYLKPWKITSSDGRFEMDFAPILDRVAETNLGIIGTFQHQIFGYLNGTVTLDDGTVLEVKDFLCGIEHIRNKY